MCGRNHDVRFRTAFRVKCRAVSTDIVLACPSDNGATGPLSGTEIANGLWYDFWSRNLRHRAYRNSSPDFRKRDRQKSYPEPDRNSWIRSAVEFT